MYTYDFSALMHHLDGDPLTAEFARLIEKHPDDDEKAKAYRRDPVTLAALVCHALLHAVELEGPPDPRTGQRAPKKDKKEDNYHRFHICEKILGREKDGLVDLDSDQVETVKRWTHQAYHIEIMGLITRILIERAVTRPAPATESPPEVTKPATEET